MKTVKSTVTKIVITGVSGLDLINVYLEDLAPSEGRIIIECYGVVWSKYWGAMGEKNIQEFFCSCDTSYLLSKLIPVGTLRYPKHKKEYLSKIIDTVKKAIEPF